MQGVQAFMHGHRPRQDNNEFKVSEREKGPSLRTLQGLHLNDRWMAEKVLFAKLPDSTRKAPYPPFPPTPPNKKKNLTPHVVATTAATAATAATTTATTTATAATTIATTTTTATATA